jgi:hypothetical protein
LNILGGLVMLSLRAVRSRYLPSRVFLRESSDTSPWDRSIRS